MKKELWVFWNGYLVSNRGRVLNIRHKEVKGYIRKEGIYQYRSMLFHINGKRVAKHLNQLVLECFSDNYQQGMDVRIVHIDGNFDNCDIDNLKIARAYTEERTAEQIKAYNENVIACVKDVFKKLKYMQFHGVDIDGALSQAYFLCWKYLAQYKVGTSFYQFCRKYAKWAFLEEYKRYKDTHTITTTDYEYYHRKEN